MYILTFYILLAKDQQRLSGNEFCTNFLHSLMIELRDIYLKNFHSMGFLNLFKLYLCFQDGAQHHSQCYFVVDRDSEFLCSCISVSWSHVSGEFS